MQPATPVAQVNTPVIPSRLTDPAGTRELAEAERELRESAEVIRESESRSRLENLFGFLRFPDILLRFGNFCLLLTVACSLFKTADFFFKLENIAIVLGMILWVGGLVGSIAFLLFVLPTAVVIITETANGHYEIKGLPGVQFMDSFGETLFAAISLLVCLIPYLMLTNLFSFIVPDLQFAQTILLIIFASLFPLLLLSALESKSPITLWSPAIYESIVEKPHCWIEFWLTNLILLIAQVLLSTLIKYVLPGPLAENTILVVINCALWVFVGFLYCRAVGLLAWRASGVFTQRSE